MAPWCRSSSEKTNKIKGKSYDDEDDATMEIEAEEEEDCMDICS